MEFAGDGAPARAVDGVSFAVDAGETVAVVGESGSGKTVTALAVMGLIDAPGRITSGDVRFDGRSLVGLAEDDYRELRGRDLAMVFQDPMTALNPVMRVGDQVAEAIRVHQAGISGRRRRPAGDRSARAGRDRRSDRARPRVPAPALRRPPAAGDAGDGAGEPSAAAHRRRAHHRARRHDAGADPRAARSSSGATSASRVVLVTHDLGRGRRPRRPRRGHVRGPHRRGRHGRRRSSPAPGIRTRGRCSRRRRAVGAERGSLVPVPGAPPNPAALPAGCAFHPRCEYAIETCRPTCLPSFPLAKRHLPQTRLSSRRCMPVPGHRSACFRAAELP